MDVLVRAEEAVDLLGQPLPLLVGNRPVVSVRIVAAAQHGERAERQPAPPPASVRVRLNDAAELAGAPSDGAPVRAHAASAPGIETVISSSRPSGRMKIASAAPKPIPPPSYSRPAASRAAIATPRISSNLIASARVIPKAASGVLATAASSMPAKMPVTVAPSHRGRPRL